ncbi:putative tetratricopeptide-like helical domain superfamily [Helianthus annuus]|uniref:Tetratricopeptide-like helical domain superfamily n=1 Tax=Helianthus annuus TaxID=4232 RepID=A0A9K3NSH7_HELAN|nr:pentatricopeptide repeat-containing protein At5g28460 [Helianthus annuus]KAF5811567.1 putative tetratricopeptide-like helical domain superfamily [Helianthus annuus]KAJ0932676.1 putative tetratricopeptide-like helical domain superfamily [Helianthus annuus]
MKKTPISASKQYIHSLLKPYKPSTTTHFRRFSVAPDSPQPPSQELTQPIITQITTTDNWTTNTTLNQQILSLTPQSLIKIAREFQTSTKALNFFNFIRENENPSLSLHPPPLDSIFQTVIQLAIREGDYASIVGLFNLSKEVKVSLTNHSAIRLISYFSCLNKVQDSMLVYDNLDPDVKNTNVRNIVLDLLLKSERFDDARQLLDEMLEPDAKFPPNEITLNIVFPVLLRRDWGNRTDDFIGLVPKFGVHGVFPNKLLLTKLITKLCRSCRNEKAWDLLHELMKFGKVEAAPCNALLSGLARERDYKKINVLLKEMKENEIKPDIVTYGMVVNHLCKSRRVDEALDMFKQMKEGSDGISVKPDVILYNTLIDGLCKVGRQEEGAALMKQMRLEDNCIPNVVTYNCLIDGFCKSGEIERSQELFDEMNNEGVDPNVITINTLVDGMCKHGRIGNAMEFFRKMQEEKGIKGNAVTYSTLISAFCSVNNIEKAMALFDEMESVGSPDALAYYSLISGLTLAGRPDDASFIASKMKKAGFQMDLVSYNTLIGGFCRKKKLDKAVEILKDMEENGVKADGVTYNTLISYFSQHGDFESAHKFLKQMIIDGNVPTVVTYGTLIHAYCLAGNLDEALDIFDKMLVSSKVPPNTVIYNVLIESLCKRGKIDHALSLMDGMVQKGVRSNTTTYNAMLKGLSSKNRLQEALRLMDQMTNQACNPDYVTLEILNDWLDAVGEIEKLRMFVQGYQVSSVAATT